ncbi:hypothetical protein TAMA11512_08890 [Selenomonas sp. TAMA-11512]|uniref:hypothetical protein n=1 Tax=Selenomonas sp. TAMA-11512 TaxID=3095337 RepID=UPI0030849A85|nr:hypothetical protein TAMA11512_08890 [Selenomonas sp. TAMA-11512]
MERDTIPIWEKATLTIEETVTLTGLGRDTVRALTFAALNGVGDFPAFKVGRTARVARLPLLDWLRDVARSHRDLKRAEAIVENAKKMGTPRGRGRPRKRREAIA